MPFHCENPDFLVHSVPDDNTFPVNRNAMERSEIFRDMFALCAPCSDASPGAEENLDLHEKAGILEVLLQLLHNPPPPPVAISFDEKFTTRLPKVRFESHTVIPLPLLSTMFELADKYVIDSPLVESLKVHLEAHAPAHPLQVYSFATLHDMDRIASEASQYVMPMASYRLDEVKVIPSVQAYHKIVRLQDFRVRALRELLLAEEIFPHGYGECTSHRDKTVASWDRQRKALAGRIETGTDVAGEMDALRDGLRDCETCYKACTAAVEMLAYKCRKVARRLHQLPEGY